MIYVCAAHQEPCDQLPFPRLYAFPRRHAVPPPESFVILDSGAYGLSQQGRTIDARYMKLLARFYARRAAPNVLCIAPDEFLNPRQTQKNFLTWHDHGYPPVVPVIQFPKVKRLDLFSMLQQSLFYLKHRALLPTYQGRPFIAISNPSLRANECRTLPKAIDLLRQAWGDVWLHNLGAGWSSQDIRDWAALGCFDSIDSISYYTDAQRGFLWTNVGEPKTDARDWHELAIENAHVARKSV